MPMGWRSGAQGASLSWQWPTSLKSIMATTPVWRPTNWESQMLAYFFTVSMKVGRKCLLGFTKHCNLTCKDFPMDITESGKMWRPQIPVLKWRYAFSSLQSGASEDQSGVLNNMKWKGWEKTESQRIGWEALLTACFIPFHNVEEGLGYPGKAFQSHVAVGWTEMGNLYFVTLKLTYIMSQSRVFVVLQSSITTRHKYYGRQMCAQIYDPTKRILK